MQTALLLKILPLLFLMTMGYLARKHFELPKRGLSKTLYYMIIPLVFFHGAMVTDFTLNLLILPIFTFVICCILCFTTFQTGGRILSGNYRNLASMNGGNANVGYFGLPLAMAMFDAKTVGLYLICAMGFNLYEVTYGFYTAARGNFTIKESVNKLLKLPVIYAFLFGLLLNGLTVDLHGSFDQFFSMLRGAYVVMGMMIIGMAIYDANGFKFDAKFICITFVAKFILFPVVTLFAIYIDQNFLNLLTTDMYKVMILASVVPMGANSIIIADLLGLKTDKIATTVLLSTLFAIVFAPYGLSILLKIIN